MDSNKIATELVKLAKSLVGSISSMEWRKDFKVGDKVRLEHAWGSEKPVEGEIKRLTNDDIWLEDGGHYGSFNWSATKIR